MTDESNAKSRTSSRLSIVVLISGKGSNLQSIIDAVSDGTMSNPDNNHNSKPIPVDIKAVISNKENAFGLQRARRAGINTDVVKDDNYDSREAYDKELQKTIDRYQPQLIVLAGFMRILSEDFVNHYKNKLINIHPSLLPKYRGLNTHQRAIDAGETEHGTTVHFVTAELDGGPQILQAKVPVLPNDSEESLAKRVLAQEHQIYPQVLAWIATSRLTIKQNQLFFDSKPLNQPLQFTPELT